MKRVEALKYIGETRYGSIEDLERKIGENNVNAFARSGFIQRGVQYPDVWRITEKGKIRSKAVSSRFFRLIARLIWKFQK